MTSLGEPLDRRVFLRKAAGFGAAASLAGLGLAVSGGSTLAVPTGYWRTTSRLNLRTGPGTSRKVILTMPEGALVQSLERAKNGFLYVSYRGTNGWAHADFLASANGDGNDVPEPIGTLRTTDRVNFRRAPSTSAAIIQVVPAGVTVDDFGLAENGFRMVGYAQTAGWIHADYLGDPGGPLGGYVVTTTALNLRAEPSTSARVLAVMPKGAKAFRGDEIANGFVGVTYNGMSGWAYMDYLQTV
jgi:uncharacterized protein YraI